MHAVHALNADARQALLYANEAHREAVRNSTGINAQLRQLREDAAINERTIRSEYEPLIQNLHRQMVALHAQPTRLEAIEKFLQDLQTTMAQNRHDIATAGALQTAARDATSTDELRALLEQLQRQVQQTRDGEDELRRQIQELTRLVAQNAAAAQIQNTQPIAESPPHSTGRAASSASHSPNYATEVARLGALIDEAQENNRTLSTRLTALTDTIVPTNMTADNVDTWIETATEQSRSAINTLTVSVITFTREFEAAAPDVQAATTSIVVRGIETEMITRQRQLQEQNLRLRTSAASIISNRENERQRMARDRAQQEEEMRAAQLASQVQDRLHIEWTDMLTSIRAQLQTENPTNMPNLIQTARRIADAVSPVNSQNFVDSLRDALMANEPWQQHIQDLVGHWLELLNSAGTMTATQQNRLTVLETEFNRIMSDIASANSLNPSLMLVDTRIAKRKPDEISLSNASAQALSFVHTPPSSITHTTHLSDDNIGAAGASPRGSKNAKTMLDIASSAFSSFFRKTPPLEEPGAAGGGSARTTADILLHARLLASASAARSIAEDALDEHNALIPGDDVSRADPRYVIWSARRKQLYEAALTTRRALERLSSPSFLDMRREHPDLEEEISTIITDADSAAERTRNQPNGHLDEFNLFRDIQDHASASWMTRYNQWSRLHAHPDSTAATPHASSPSSTASSLPGDRAPPNLQGSVAWRTARERSDAWRTIKFNLDGTVNRTTVVGREIHRAILGNYPVAGFQAKEWQYLVNIETAKDAKGKKKK